MLRECARLLRNVVYLRDTAPVMLTRAAEAGGRPAPDRDGEAVEIGGVRHRAGTLLLTAATAGRVAWSLDDRAVFWRHLRSESRWVPTHCPADDVAGRIVDAAVDLPFFPCSGIVRVPLLADGRLVAKRGYDPASGVILDLDGPPPEVPRVLGRQVARRAAARLLRPFRGYLRNKAVDKTALLAAVLGAVMRASLPGVPIILIDGNSPAVGKGKLARAIAALVYGTVPAIITEGHSPEELEKRLAAAVLQGVPVLLLDNLQRPLESSTLESMATEPCATIRTFGKLDQMTVPCRALVLITANNASVRSDLLRRSLHVRIVVLDETPELRRFGFDPVEEVLRDRHALLSDAFAVLMAWQAERADPCCRVESKVLGSFEAWSASVAGAVAWLTGRNPIDLIEDRKREDPKRAGDAAVFAALAAWQATLREGNDAGEPRAWWRSAEAAEGISPTVWANVLFLKADKPSTRQVGIWLAGRRDAVGSGFVLRGRTDRKDIGWWSVERAPALPALAGFPVTRHAENGGRSIVIEGDKGAASFGEAEGVKTRQEPAKPAPPGGGASRTVLVSGGPASPPIAIPTGEKAPSSVPEPGGGDPRQVDLEEAIAAAVAESSTVGTGYRLITDVEEARRALAALADRGATVGLDLETTGLDPIRDQARLLQVAASGEPVLVVDLFRAGGLGALAGPLGGLRAIAHNAVFDAGFLCQAGVSLTLGCTRIADNVLAGRGLASLVEVAERHLGVVLDKGQQRSDWSGELSEAQLRYAAADAAVLPPLFEKLRERLREDGATRAYALARDAQPAVVAMRLAGMPFDADAHRALLARLTAERDRLLEALGEVLAGRNPASGEQLAAWLAWALRGDPDVLAGWPRTGSGRQLATGADALARGLHLLPPGKAAVVRDLLLPFKVVEKRLSAFGTNLAGRLHPVTGRVHADFRLAATVAGRMSCADPNLQQVPRDPEFRRLFRAPGGRKLVIADYGQVELRVAAVLAGEETMLGTFRDGGDVHRLAAGLILGKPPEAVTRGERQLAKAVNFGLLFGQGARGLQGYAASSYGVEIMLGEAARHREAWFDAFPAFRRWQGRVRRRAEKELAVRTPAGRVRRWSDDPKSRDGFRATEAFNTPVQGGAAEAMMAALGRLPAALEAAGLDAVPVAVVHDELILEAGAGQADAAARVLREVMTAGFLDVFPAASTVGLVEAGVGGSWADK